MGKKKSQSLHVVPGPTEDELKAFPGPQNMQEAVADIIEFIGDDPKRQGLLETPGRVVRAWGEWFSGYKQDPKDVLKTFEDGAEGADEMVLETSIPVYSHCEHHMTPFVGVAHVAYLPAKRIAGLSKLARVVDIYARRLQVQERLTAQIADALNDNLKPRGVGVVITAQHFCMCTRGVKLAGVNTTTSALRGAFKKDSAVRNEFLNLITLAKQTEVA